MEDSNEEFSDNILYGEYEDDDPEEYIEEETDESDLYAIRFDDIDLSETNGIVNIHVLIKKLRDSEREESPTKDKNLNNDDEEIISQEEDVNLSEESDQEAIKDACGYDENDPFIDDSMLVQARKYKKKKKTGSNALDEFVNMDSSAIGPLGKLKIKTKESPIKKRDVVPSEIELMINNMIKDHIEIIDKQRGKPRPRIPDELNEDLKKIANLIKTKYYNETSNIYRRLEHLTCFKSSSFKRKLNRLVNTDLMEVSKNELDKILDVIHNKAIQDAALFEHAKNNNENAPNLLRRTDEKTGEVKVMYRPRWDQTFGADIEKAWKLNDDFQKTLHYLKKDKTPYDSTKERKLLFQRLKSLWPKGFIKSSQLSLFFKRKKEKNEKEKKKKQGEGEFSLPNEILQAQTQLSTSTYSYLHTHTQQQSQIKSDVQISLNSLNKNSNIVKKQKKRQRSNSNTSQTQNPKKNAHMQPNLNHIFENLPKDPWSSEFFIPIDFEPSKNKFPSQSTSQNEPNFEPSKNKFPSQSTSQNEPNFEPSKNKSPSQSINTTSIISKNEPNFEPLKNKPIISLEKSQEPESVKVEYSSINPPVDSNTNIHSMISTIKTVSPNIKNLVERIHKDPHPHLNNFYSDPKIPEQLKNSVETTFKSSHI